MLKRKYLICLFILFGIPIILKDDIVVNIFKYFEWIDFRKLKSTSSPSVNYSPVGNRTSSQLVLNKLNIELENSTLIRDLDSLGSIFDSGKGSEEQSFEIIKNLQEMIRASISNKNQDNCSVSTKKHFLVIPHLGGRLGNQMFAFASSLGIASAIHYQLIIPITHSILKYFDQKYASKMVPTNLLTLSEDAWKKMIASSNMKWLCHNLTLKGHFQSYRYFEHIASTIRKSFVFRQDTLKTAEVFLASEIPENAIKVGIHVRRGDFLSTQSITEGRLVAEISYIRKAMTFFRKEYKHVHFIVCSNDRAWCQNNINSSDVTFSQFQVPTIDMAILTLCDHVIMTVGTFGWWGGWLSGGTVVYLSDYAKPGSHAEKKAPRESYYPPKWIGMSNADN